MMVKFTFRPGSSLMTHGQSADPIPRSSATALEMYPEGVYNWREWGWLHRSSPSLATENKAIFIVLPYLCKSNTVKLYNHPPIQTPTHQHPYIHTHTHTYIGASLSVLVCWCVIYIYMFLDPRVTTVRHKIDRLSIPNTYTLYPHTNKLAPIN